MSGLCTGCGNLTNDCTCADRQCTANTRQVGGAHYQTESGKQHWDMVAEFGLDYYQGQITRYLFRWRKKNGLEDLRKAQHFLEKYIELASQEKVV